MSISPSAVNGVVVGGMIPRTCAMALFPLRLGRGRKVGAAAGAVTGGGHAAGLDTG